MPGTPVTAFMLRERLTDLLEGKVTLGEFDEWFAVHTWDDDDVALDARQLANRVELVLAEFTSGHRTWHETREDLEGLARRADVTLGGAPSGMRIIGSATGMTSWGRALHGLPVIREVSPENPSEEANTQRVEVFV